MKYQETGVLFQTNDIQLQQTYELAESRLKDNLKEFAGRRVLVEGGGYSKIWLETQPMGGEMYAKRDLLAAVNNQLLFMETQRVDGRLPGSIMEEGGKLIPQFNKFQGFCFPGPALNVYYWLGQDRAYLIKLQKALTGFDRYLWLNRDSNRDGCLESWCVTDTGEDGALRYGDAPFWWEEEQPPEGYSVVPMASMDFMGYSCAARETLSDISRILGDGEETFWAGQAEDVRRKIRGYLWDEERGACFDRDNTGKRMETLVHNTLRLMYWNALSPGMARRFVDEHLLNPKEFWTPFPLPSVAANDPLFRNHPGNDWSGQPQGLTWQRAITALENYGYDQLIPVLADKLFSALKHDRVFTQQFDPFTGQGTGGKDGYGPTMLAFLEYVSRVHGVHLHGEELWWGAVGTCRTEYELAWGERRFRLVSDGRQAQAAVDGKPAFAFAAGQKIVTDYNGNIKRKVQLKSH